jgi:hypothetical protein
MDRWTEQFFHGGREQGRRFHSPSAWARVHFALASLSSESDLPSLVELLQMFLYSSCLSAFLQPSACQIKNEHPDLMYGRGVGKFSVVVRHRAVASL